MRIPCLELVAEDLADDNTYMGRCLHCRRELHAQRVSSGAVPSGVLAHIVGWCGGRSLSPNPYDLRPLSKRN